MANYFYIEALEQEVELRLSLLGTPSITIEFSLEKGYHSSFPPYDIVWEYFGNSGTVSISPGEKVYFRNEHNYNTRISGADYYFNFSANAPFRIGGDIGFLVNKNGTTNIPYSAFRSMFKGCTGLTELPSGLLPANATLGNNACAYMFEDCVNIKNLPSDLLPATNLGDYCYEGMFKGCTGLTELPSGLLPATTLSMWGRTYIRMFQNCVNLEKIPSDLLPALYISYESYIEMFDGCSKLGISEVEDDTHHTPFRIPANGEGTYDKEAMTTPVDYMFNGTKGPFIGTPEINKTYYLYGVSYYNINTTIIGEGTCNLPTGEYPQGEYTLTAQPAPGDKVRRCLVDNVEVELPFTFNLNNNINIEIEFAPLDTFDVVVEIEGNGQVTGIGSGRYIEGTVFEDINVIPSPGWRLSSISVNGELKVVPFSLVLEKNTNVRAIFVKLASPIKILFDGVELNEDAIMDIKLNATMFNETFGLGKTVCKELDLKVNKQFINNHPSVITIADNYETLMTLYVDNVEEEDNNCYSYTLCDKMVLLNLPLKNVIPEGIELTVQNILNVICSFFNSTVPNIDYGEDIIIIWNNEQTCREFLGWVAEINCSFAKIDNLGNIVLKKMNRESVDIIDIQSCEDISIGEKRKIDRVYYEQGDASYYYPENLEEGETLYLNGENPLFTDSGNYTIQEMVKHIYDEMHDFEFYNLKSNKCKLSDVADVGDIITFVDTVSNKEYKTIVQLDHTYNTKWLGGYNLEVANGKQEETKIISTEKKLSKVRILVDRANGRIEQVVSDAENHTGSFAIYLDKNDTGQIISMINASADNIILNTKSLIFGEYPDGQYVEEKNFYSNEDLEYIKSLGIDVLRMDGFSIDEAENTWLIFAFEIDENEITDGYIYANCDGTNEPNSTYVAIKNGKLVAKMHNSDELILDDIEIKPKQKYKIRLEFNTHNIVINDKVGYRFVNYSYRPSLIPYFYGYKAETKTETFKCNIYYIYVWEYVSSTGINRLHEYTGKLFEDTYEVGFYDKKGSRTIKVSASDFGYAFAKQGVLFDGSGEVRFSIQNRFMAQNYSGNTLNNQIDMLHTEDVSLFSNSIRLSNYNDNNEILNQIYLDCSNRNRSSMLLANGYNFSGEGLYKNKLEFLNNGDTKVSEAILGNYFEPQNNCYLYMKSSFVINNKAQEDTYLRTVINSVSTNTIRLFSEVDGDNFIEIRSNGEIRIYGTHLYFNNQQKW